MMMMMTQLMTTTANTLIFAVLCLSAIRSRDTVAPSIVRDQETYRLYRVFQK